MKCCVVDDEPLAARLIASYIERTPYMELAGVYSSAREAVRTIINGDADVAFLDIRMPQLDGIEFARIVPDSVQLVFTTAYSDYAIEAFKVGAADYLLKPVSFEDFSATAERLYKRHNLMHTEATLAPVADGRILVKSGHGMEQIDTEQIMLVESWKEYVKIYLDGRATAIVTLSTMRTIEKHLPESSFMRVHRSFIINTRRIQRMDRQKIVVADREIPVGDSFRTRVAEYIATHLPAE